MLFALAQDIVVTVFALGAAAVIFRRVAGFVRTPAGPSKCSSCPSAVAQRRTQSEAPLTFVRRTDGR